MALDSCARALEQHLRLGPGERRFSCGSLLKQLPSDPPVSGEWCLVLIPNGFHGVICCVLRLFPFPAWEGASWRACLLLFSCVQAMHLTAALITHCCAVANPALVCAVLQMRWKCAPCLRPMSGWH